ncbi:MAG TPA: hypothetical protein VGI78_02230 [Acetobacteraceae bacterium]|jgi:hypothetical protein
MQNDKPTDITQGVKLPPLIDAEAFKEVLERAAKAIGSGRHRPDRNPWPPKQGEMP